MQEKTIEYLRNLQNIIDYGVFSLLKKLTEIRRKITLRASYKEIVKEADDFMKDFYQITRKIDFNEDPTDLTFKILTEKDNKTTKFINEVTSIVGLDVLILIRELFVRIKRFENDVTLGLSFGEFKKEENEIIEFSNQISKQIREKIPTEIWKEDKEKEAKDK